jgi:hypothetical protein
MGGKPSKSQNTQKIVYKERQRTPCENKMDELQGYDNKTYEYKLCTASECTNDPEFRKDYGNKYCKFQGFTSLIEGYTPRIEASALQSARKAKDSAGDSNMYAKSSLRGAINTWKHEDRALQNSQVAQSASKQAISSSGTAKNSAGIAKSASEYAREYSDGAQKQFQGAQSSSQGAKKSAQDALESANKTQELQQDTQVLNSNTQSDVNALQQTVGLHTNTGNTAAENNRKLRELEVKEGQLEQLETSIPLSREQVEEQLFSFQSDGYPYLEGLDENLKINILTHMVRYMQDFADIYRDYVKDMFENNYYENNPEKKKIKDSEFNTQIPEWLKDIKGGTNYTNYIIMMYYYTKYNYENSGSETLGYQVFLNIKNVLSTMFDSNTMKKATPGSIFAFLNSNDQEVRKIKYTYYLENKSKQPFTNIKEYFTNLIEGNTGMSGTTTDPLVQNNDNFIDIVRGFLDTTQSSLNIDRTNLENSINNIKRYQDGEFLAQRDTIMNNVLMDYMINNKEGSNIEQVYGKLNQEKNDKLRKTKIAAYYTKSFKEYIYLLKIVIFLIVLMIPILIFKRLEILDKSLTLLLVVTIITLGFLYISYRLYILYTRDSKDFDKFKIPFTRTEAANLKSKGSRYSKDSPLKSLGITCIGEECCDASMVYDKLRDKCVASENFGNYFENAQELNNQQKNIIKENNSHEDESNFAFLGGNANVIENFRSMEGIKQRLLLDSLNNSSERKFNN